MGEIRELISYLYFQEQLTTAQLYGRAWLPSRNCGIPEGDTKRFNKAIQANNRGSIDHDKATTIGNRSAAAAVFVVATASTTTGL